MLYDIGYTESGVLAWCHPFVSPPKGVLFCRYATTQLALQLRQGWSQVVCSNKEARKRLTDSNGTPAMDLGHMNVVLK